MSQLNVDTIAESSDGVGVSIVDARIDTIEELTTGAGVTITGLKTTNPSVTLPVGGDADLTTTTLGWIFASGIAKSIGLSRLAGFIARQFGIYIVTDPKFGAVGDGVTDDTAAIAAADAALTAAGGGVMFFPAGTYKGAIPTPTVPILYMGQGAAYTKVQAFGIGTTTDLFFFDAQALAVEGGQGGGIVGMTLDMNSLGRNAYRNRGWKFLRFDDVSILNGRTGQVGMYVTQADTTVTNNREPIGCTYDRVIVSADSYALHLYAQNTTNGAPQVVLQSFRGCQFTSLSDHTVVMQTAADIAGVQNIQRILFDNCNTFVRTTGKDAVRLECLGSGPIQNVRWNASHLEVEPGSGATGTVGLHTIPGSASINNIDFHGEIATATKYTMGSGTYTGGVTVRTESFGPTYSTARFYNAQDAETAIVGQAGSTVEQAWALYLRDMGGTNRWSIRRQSDNQFRVRDEVTALDRIGCNIGSDAISKVNSDGTQPVQFNVENGAGTGGIEIGKGDGSTKAGILVGSGSPEGAVTATVGKLYLRTDGGASTTLYVKESGTGNTGWIAK